METALLKQVKKGFALLAGLLLAVTLTGCSASNDSSSKEEEVQRETIEAHGLEYAKAETVNVTTDMLGSVKEIKVSEWLKNPDAKQSIEDISTLTEIEAEDDIAFEQNGQNIVWAADGRDVVYSGVSNQDLPFEISYKYKLDGVEVEPSAIQNVTGKLEVTITYKNKTSGTVKAAGGSYRIQMPYMMASVMSFDSEHATNIEVDNGQVVDQQGMFMAIGNAMPGLAKSLELESYLDLADSVTISADVFGYDLSGITTMVTDRMLGAVNGKDNKTSNEIDNVFASLTGFEQAISALGDADAKIGEGVGTMAEGQKKLNDATSGIAGGLAGLGQKATELDTLLKNDSSALSIEEMNKLKALRDSFEVNSENYKLLDDAIKSMEEAQNTLKEAKSSSAQLAAGISGTAEGLTQIQAGYEGINEAMGQLKTALDALSKAEQEMSQAVGEQIESARGQINTKIKLIEALDNYAKKQGAFCGNASDMSASTTFIVSAQV